MTVDGYREVQRQEDRPRAGQWRALFRLFRFQPAEFIKGLDGPSYFRSGETVWVQRRIPFDGSPIKLKRVKGEWLIYSVGPNLKDDGGQVEGIMDVGIGPLPPNWR